jgi:hypothetical protein
LIRSHKWEGEGYGYRCAETAGKVTADQYCYDELDEILDISKHGGCRDLRLGSLTPIITWNEEYDTNRAQKTPACNFSRAKEG